MAGRSLTFAHQFLAPGANDSGEVVHAARFLGGSAKSLRSTASGVSKPIRFSDKALMTSGESLTCFVGR